MNYLGTSSAPTSRVDVYVDAASIKKPYTIIGKGYMLGPSVGKRHIDKIQKKAMETAMEKGADAILFQDYFLAENGSAIHNVTKTDSSGSRVVTVQDGSVTPILSSRTDIFFLKYQ